MRTGFDQTTLIINLCVVAMAAAVIAEAIEIFKAATRTDSVGLGLFWPVIGTVPFLFVFRRRGVSILFLVMYFAVFLLELPTLVDVYRGVPIYRDGKSFNFFLAAASMIGLLALLYCFVRAAIDFVVPRF